MRAVGDEELSAVFADSGCVLATRQRLDGLVLDVLSAPGMGGEALQRLDRFLDSEQLRRGADAWARLSAAMEADDVRRGPA